MTEDHKNKLVEMIMNDYDIRPSLARLIVQVFIDSAEKIIKEDAEIISGQIKNNLIEDKE